MEGKNKTKKIKNYEQACEILMQLNFVKSESESCVEAKNQTSSLLSIF